MRALHPHYKPLPLILLLGSDAQLGVVQQPRRLLRARAALLLLFLYQLASSLVDHSLAKVLLRIPLLSCLRQPLLGQQRTVTHRTVTQAR